jgi:hypothetical protein
VHRNRVSSRTRLERSYPLAVEAGAEKKKIQQFWLHFSSDPDGHDHIDDDILCVLGPSCGALSWYGRIVER